MERTNCVLAVGQSDDEELFGNVHGVLVYCQEVLFEFEFIEAQYCKHYHAYALSLPLASSCQKYLTEQINLLSFGPYGMYHC